MTSTMRQTYLRDASETASPQRLVVMLYDALVDDLELAEGSLQDRNRADAHGRLVHAQAILLELLSSLEASTWDPGRGLANLYVYLVRELMRANVDRDPGRVAAVRRLLEPLRDAWRDALEQVSRHRVREQIA